MKSIFVRIMSAISDVSLLAMAGLIVLGVTLARGGVNLDTYIDRELLGGIDADPGTGPFDGGEGGVK